MILDLKLEKKVVLVTASSRGLGKAVAIAMAKEGAYLVICARGKDDLMQTARIIDKYGVKCLAIQCDLTKYDEVQNLIKETLETFGTIDVLVVNCGGPPAGSFSDFEIDDWKNAINQVLMSSIYLCKETIPVMKQNQNGRIIIITSVSVKQPIKGLILSNVTRAGVAGLSKSLSEELGKDNILINIVCPSYTHTQRVEELADFLSIKQRISKEEIMQNWSNLNALGRIAKPEEIANVIVFLASAQASHITGIALQIDGGYVKSLL